MTVCKVPRVSQIPIPPRWVSFLQVLVQIIRDDLLLPYSVAANLRQNGNAEAR